MTVAAIVAAALLGAFMHRLRGGGFKPMVPRFGLGRSLWLVTPIVGLLALPFVGALPATYLAALYLIGSVSGWGSYFSCGRKETWGDDPEVEWIDRVLLELFGPMWAADKDKINPIHDARGDVVYNEGRVRSFEWRRKRACTGMALRGLHYVPMMLVIPTASGSWLALIPGIIAVALFAPAYRIGWLTKWNTGAAEYIVGGVFGAALATQYLIGA